MKRDGASRIKGFTIDVQSYEALRKQLFFSADLSHENDRQVIDRSKLQARVHALNKTPSTTPPQIDICKRKDTRSKTRTDVVGLRRWKTPSSLVASSARTIFPSEKFMLLPCHVPTRYNGKKYSTSIKLFYGFALHQKDSRFAHLTTSSLFSYTIISKSVGVQLHDQPKYVRRYDHPTILNRESDSQKTTCSVAFKTSSWFISERDQKKDGKRPVPGKPEKPEPEKPKPEREGDKGKRKGKSPRTEQPVP